MTPAKIHSIKEHTGRRPGLTDDERQIASRIVMLHRRAPVLAQAMSMFVGRVLERPELSRPGASVEEQLNAFRVTQTALRDISPSVFGTEFSALNERLSRLRRLSQGCAHFVDNIIEGMLDELDDEPTLKGGA